MPWRYQLTLTIALLSVIVGASSRPTAADATTLKAVAVGRALRNLDLDFPDPFVLSAEGRYYAYATNSGGVHVPTLVSTDLVRWRRLEDAVPVLPRWAHSSNLTWAPSVLRVRRQFLMYISVWEDRLGRHCIAIATAKHPAGPFTLQTKPLVCGRGAIDASTFRDAGGSQWLTWKFEAYGGRSTRIVSRRLSDDGQRLVGTTSVLITPTQRWENGVVEGPAMIDRNGIYLLFYSASDWTSDHYATGIALCASPRGPCIKSQKPFLSSTTGRISPGGLTAFRSGGRLDVAYHVWRYAVGYPRGRRQPVIAQVNFNEGTPQLATMG